MKKIVLLILLIPSLLWGEVSNFYVDISVTSSGNGAIETPYKNFSDISWSLVGTLIGLDQTVFINLKRDETWNETLTIGSSGSATATITIQAYDEGVNPIINGQDDTGDGDRDYGIQLNAVDYITVDGLTVTEFKKKNILIENGSDHIIIQNSVSDNCTGDAGNEGDGIFFNWNAGDNSIIQDNEVSGNMNGIGSWKFSAPTSGNEVIVRRNDVHDNNHDGIHIWSNYWIVEYNKVYDNGMVGGGGAANEWVAIHAYTETDTQDNCENNIIRYNEVYNQLGAGNDGAGVSVDQWCDNTTVYGNIAYNNDGPCMYVFDGANAKFYNNTCYGNCQDSSGELTGKAEIRVDNSGVQNDLAVNFIFKNNAVYATEADTYAILVDEEGVDNSPTITNNMWYGTATNWYFWDTTAGATLSTWNALTGVGTDLNEDPLFDNATAGEFTLKVASPALTGAEAIVGYASRLAPSSIWADQVNLMVYPNSIGAYGASLHSESCNNPPYLVKPNGCYINRSNVIKPKKVR